MSNGSWDTDRKLERDHSREPGPRNSAYPRPLTPTQRRAALALRYGSATCSACGESSCICVYDGEPCQPLHDRARQDADVFARLLIPIGSMPTEDDEGRPMRLRLGNCPYCSSTLAREEAA